MGAEAEAVCGCRWLL